jgi:hypothetical protein
MSRMDDDGIRLEIKQIDTLLATYRSNYYLLQQQEAKSGGNPDIPLRNNIIDHQRIISELVSRKNELEIQVVEEDYSLAEAEYRVMAAEAWQPGHLTTLATAQLEYTRLRLKIPFDRAKQIEHEVKVGLVEEAFRSLDVGCLFDHTHDSDKTHDSVVVSFQTISRLLIMDTDITISYFRKHFDPTFTYDLHYFTDQLFKIEGWRYYSIHRDFYDEVFGKFMDSIREIQEPDKDI